MTYTVTYQDAQPVTTTLTAANITLNQTGTAGGVASVTGGGTSYTVTLSSLTGDGTLGISIAAGTAHDAANNPAPAAGPSATFAVDNTPPTLFISAPSATLASSASGPVTYQVTYADPHLNLGVTTLKLMDITLNKTGTADASVSLTGSGTSYQVSLANLTGDGTLSITIAPGTGSDTAGNLVPGAGPSSSFTVENTPPSVVLSGPSASAASSGPVTYTVTYQGPNFASSTLSPADITLNRTGTANGTVSVSGAGASRTVTISAISGDGTLGISLAAATAVDTVGNPAPAAGPSSTFDVENTPVAIGMSAPSAPWAAAGPVTYQVTYTDPHFHTSTLTAGDVTLNRTGSANGTVGVTGGGTSYTVTLSSLTGEGTLGISIAPGTASDTAGNLALPAGPSATFDVDNTPPTIAISAPSIGITSHGPVTYTVNYSDAHLNLAATTLTAAEVILNKTGTADGTVNVTGAGAPYTVTLANLTGDGTLGISIAAGTASDTVGNQALAAGPSASFAVENTPVALSLTGPSTAVVAHGPVTYQVTYADAFFDRSTLTANDITLHKTGTANGIANVTGGGKAYTITLASLTGDGTITLSVTPGTASDLAGNLTPGSGPSAPVAVDNTPPVAAISPPSSVTTSSGPVDYTVTFTEAHFVPGSLASDRFVLNHTGTAAAALGVRGAGPQYTVTLSSITGDGTLGISMTDGAVSDAAGNRSPAAGPSATITVVNTLFTSAILPARLAVGLGDSAVFTAVSTVLAPRSFQWLFQGQPLPGETRATLTLVNAQYAQAGNYAVVVANAFSTATSANAPLTVAPRRDPPAIRVPPANTAAFVGGQATFAVQASGSDPLQYQWRWNGAPLAWATAPSVTLLNLAAEHSGQYDVVIHNDFGTITSPAAQLSVSTLALWGRILDNEALPANPANPPIALALGPYHDVALLSNRTVVAWGDNRYGQCLVPDGLTQVVAVSAGVQHSLALTAGGTVVAWGTNWLGQTEVPASLSDVAAISCGGFHSLALKNDGTVVAWGYNWQGQCDVPAGLSEVQAVAAGLFHSLALKRDGTVVAWGNNITGQGKAPPGLGNVAAISAGSYHNTVILGDGTVFSWGDNRYGQLNTPAGLRDVVQVACGEAHSIALKRDGTVAVWGHDEWGQNEVPPDLRRVSFVAAGDSRSAALVAPTP